MKLKILFVCVAIAAAELCFGADVTVSGDVSVARTPSVARIQFDFSDMTVKGKAQADYTNSKGKDFADQGQYVEKFIAQWNYQIKDGLQLSPTNDAAEFIVFFIVKDMDSGHYMATKLAGPNAGGAKMTGIMYFFRGNDFRHPSLTVEINNMSGLSELTEDERFTNLYINLAMRLTKALKKAKDSDVSSKTPPVLLSSGIRESIASGIYGTDAIVPATPASDSIWGESSSSTWGDSSSSTWADSSTSGSTWGDSSSSTWGDASSSGSTWGDSSASGSTSGSTWTSSSDSGSDNSTAWWEVSSDDSDSNNSSVPEANAASSESTAEPAPRPVVEVSVPETVLSASADSNVGSSLDFLKDEKRVSVFIDFSNALIDDKTEDEYIEYMIYSAKDRDRDVNFASTWSQCVGAQFPQAFISKANDALRKKGLELRLVAKQGNPYTLKIAVDDIDTKGGNKSDYLIVETETGNVLAKISDEVKGLPMAMGKAVNMLEFCFKSAGDKFGTDIAAQLVEE